MPLLIFANGEMEEVEWVRPYLTQATAVWAADGGSKHLKRLGRLPDRVIGDMDSLPPEVQAWLTAGQVPFNQHPPAKDETDLELALLLAVLEKRAGLNLAGEDVFVNVAGGFTVDERAADLGIVAAVVSSVRNRPVRQGTAVFGEVGLAGEVRATGQSLLRVREAAQMGFTRCVLPTGNAQDEALTGCEVVGVRTVGEALDEVIGWD